MIDRSSSSLTLWAANIFAVCLVAVGIVSQRPDLYSLRPSAQQSYDAGNGDPDSILARLWEDPIEAARQKQKQIATGAAVPKVGEHTRTVPPASDRVEATDRTPLTSESDDQSSAKGTTLSVSQKAIMVESSRPAPTVGSKEELPILVLPVFLGGMAYADDRERRLRARYAVLSALATSGYIHEQRERLAYKVLKDSQGHEFPTVNETLRLDQRMTSDGKACHGATYSFVVVWWIESSRFTLDPLLWNDLVRLTKEAFSRPGLDASCTLKAIHCEGTDDLRKTLQIANADPNPKRLPETAFTKGSGIFFPRATAPRKLIELEFADARAGFAPKPNFTVKDDKGDEVPIYRYLATDDRLISALVRELGRRIPDFGRDTPIALVAEWDTLYSRGTTRTFSAYFRAHIDPGPINLNDSGSWSDATPNIHVYSYLRGIDGNTIAARNDGEKQTTPADASSSLKTLLATKGRSEQLADTSQYDYLRRLARRMKVDAHRYSPDHPSFKAIGVLGSDVYDKVLVLQALRSEFSDVVFFTTDLDALYLQAPDFKAVRNLVIATAFDLQLEDPNLQAKIPPFRDSYQTSIYLSSLQAVGFRTTQVEKEVGTKIFEVGRNGFNPLWSDHEETRPATLSQERLAEPAAMPRRVPSRSFSAGLVCFVILALVGSLWPKSLPIMAWSVGIALVGLALLALWKGRDLMEGEPWAFANGISIWPTVLMRLLAALLAIFFLWHANRDYLASRLTLSKKYDLDSQAQNILHWRLALLGWTDPGSQKVWTVEEVWRRYLSATQARIRIIRVALWVILYLIFLTIFVGFLAAIGLFSQQEAFIPGRGFWSFVAENVMLVAGVLMFTTHLWFCFDLHLACARLIRHLSDTMDDVPLRGRRRHSEYEIMEICADHSEVVGRTLMYPFCVLLLMIVARSTVFDGWDWPPQLVLIMVVGLCIVYGCAIYLWRTASEGRRKAISCLQSKLRKAVAEKEKIGQQPRAAVRAIDADIERRKQRIEHIKNLNVGAFGSVWTNPLFAAPAILFTAFGSLAVINPLLTLLR